MKTALVFIIFIFTCSGVFSQKQIEFAITCQDGNLFRNDANVYSFGPFKIIGLKTKADFEQFEKQLKKQSIVTKFEYVAPDNADGTKNAMLSINTNEENAIVNLFKAINLSKLTVNDRSFTIDQKEDLKAYLQELKNKHLEKQNFIQNQRRAVPQPKNQTNE
ncbi:MAG: hypothetical protein N2449_01810 [Bacteroidales bacterium]|nr:hypothetical protein [Bacteroidales bacterium]